MRKTGKIPLYITTHIWGGKMGYNYQTSYLKTGYTGTVWVNRKNGTFTKMWNLRLLNHLVCFYFPNWKRIRAQHHSKITTTTKCQNFSYFNSNYHKSAEGQQKAAFWDRWKVEIFSWKNSKLFLQSSFGFFSLHFIF